MPYPPPFFPRSLDATPWYHEISRRVGRAFLCSKNTVTGWNYEDPRPSPGLRRRPHPATIVGLGATRAERRRAADDHAGRAIDYKSEALRALFIRVQS